MCVCVCGAVAVSVGVKRCMCVRLCVRICTCMYKSFVCANTKPPRRAVALAHAALSVAKCCYSHAIKITIIIIYNIVVVVVLFSVQINPSSKRATPCHEHITTTTTATALSRASRQSCYDASRHLTRTNTQPITHPPTYQTHNTAENRRRWFLRCTRQRDKSSIGDISKFDFKRTDDTVHLPDAFNPSRPFSRSTRTRTAKTKNSRFHASSSPSPSSASSWLLCRR